MIVKMRIESLRCSLAINTRLVSRVCFGDTNSNGFRRLSVCYVGKQDVDYIDLESDEAEKVFETIVCAMEKDCK